MSSRGAYGADRPAPGRLSMFRVGLLVLVVVTAAWRWWTASHWSWFADDWIYLDQTQSMGFLEYVFQGYNSHLMPGQFLLTWVITAAAPLDYTWAALTLTLLAVASVLAWALALREVFGERVQLLFPLTFIAISPVLLMPTVWWASGIQVLPLQLAMGLSVLFLARLVLRGRRRDLVWLVLSYGLGLFFWQKALLIMVPLALVAWVLVPGGPRARLVATAKALVVPIVMSLAYIAVYLPTRRSGAIDMPRTEFAPRSAQDWWRFMSTSAQDVGLPTLAGGPFQLMSDAWDTYDPTSTRLRLALGVLFLLGAVLALALRRHGVPAVACLFVYALTTWGLVVTSARFTLDGSDGMGRYAADIVPVAALVVALLTTRTVLEPAGSALRRPLHGRALTVGRRGLVLVAAAVTVAMVTVNVATWRVASESSPGPWVRNLVADSARAGGASLVDTPAPEHVVHPILFMEYATLSRMLGPMGLPLRFDAPSELILVADAEGHLREADVVDHAAANHPAPDNRCGFPVPPGGTTDVPLTLDLYPWGWAVRLDYFTGRPTTATVTTDNEVIELDLEEGLNMVQFKVADSINDFRVTAAPGGKTVCVTQVFIGAFKASDRSPWR